MKVQENYKFAVCVENAGYSASLELRKIYQVIADADAGHNGEMRVVDESGEDYLYPERYFIVLDLSDEVTRVLLLAT